VKRRPAIADFVHVLGEVGAKLCVRNVAHGDP
jgi:hypothetical protein